MHATLDKREPCILIHPSPVTNSSASGSTWSPTLPGGRGGVWNHYLPTAQQYRAFGTSAYIMPHITNQTLESRDRDGEYDAHALILLVNLS